jgi:transcriptional regulator with XRE-family HTH domain
MPDSFGARLRRRREERQIALSTVAEQTKIKLSLLDALERDDVSHWPSGIFRRAFIRAYAVAIGAEPDLVVREFLEVYPEPAGADVAAAALAARIEDARSNAAPPTRLHHIVGSAIESLARLRRSGPSEDLVVAGPVERQVQAAGGPAVVADRALEVAEVETRPEVSATDTLQEAARAGTLQPGESRATDVDLLALARLCTELGRVGGVAELQRLLEQSAAFVGAAGLVVWVWDAQAAELRPALASGYSDQVLAHLPAVKRDAENATALAFRSAEACAIDGGGNSSGALVVPLLTPAGCAGVLAFELQHGRQPTGEARAIATILAALLAPLASGPSEADVLPSAAGGTG